MKAFRKKLESGFINYGGWVHKYRWQALLGTMLFIGALLFSLPNLMVDMSTEAYFYPQDPALLNYEAFQEQFGREEIIVAGIKIPEQFDLAFINFTYKYFNDPVTVFLPELYDTGIQSIRKPFHPAFYLFRVDLHGFTVTTQLSE